MKIIEKEMIRRYRMLWMCNSYRKWTQRERLFFGFRGAKKSKSQSTKEEFRRKGGEGGLVSVVHAVVLEWSALHSTTWRSSGISTTVESTVAESTTAATSTSSTESAAGWLIALLADLSESVESEGVKFQRKLPDSGFVASGHVEDGLNALFGAHRDEGERVLRSVVRAVKHLAGHTHLFDLSVLVEHLFDLGFCLGGVARHNLTGDSSEVNLSLQKTCSVLSSLLLLLLLLLLLTGRLLQMLNGSGMFGACSLSLSLLVDGLMSCLLLEHSGGLHVLLVHLLLMDL